MSQVREVDPLAGSEWDAYVRSHPHGTAYHLAGWSRVLRRAYGFRARYLALRDNSAGRLTGVLPLFHKKGLVSDARLRSIPVFSYGGPLADSPGGEAVLLDAVRALADRATVPGVSINTGVRRLSGDGFASEEILPRWTLELPEDLESLRAGWRKSSNNLFRSLKKADSAGLTFREALRPHELRSFQHLYARTMRSHRSLPRSLRQVRGAQQLLPDVVKVFIVDYDGWDVAAGVYHVFGDTIELVYNGSDERALEKRPNHFLYWQVLLWAAARGLRRMDLGGAYADTPLARFKQQWGAVPERRFRLERRAGGEPTRAESIAQVGYGAEGSERRIVALAWRYVPLPLLRAGAHVAYRYV